ncbi:HlyD family efflux transporter periplasmic adaptor subunit [uncultured Oscillibacter sp.]|jgi:HlyD family secretion protein|uniref:HlyD family efflux transporter periplasmic adaptor subunit n=2 Tax=uncultured Oscillibacter sp. TaxID=876091 RepID=UPI00216BB23D|nr:HlyD family efflux transporter periplasmic adaptor subunit [uncultured Oscillibacter sp.]MCI9554841.1 HlyD family efflux transporter periplasmic adaptor subunit [Oscillibacter sp.]
MSEVMDREQQTGTAQAAPQAAPEAAPPPAPETAEKTSLWKKWKGMPRRKRRKIVRWFLFLLILIAIGVGVRQFLAGKNAGEQTEVLTATVQYGSITATVDGSGLTKAKDSETITIATTGTVSEVFVSEGDTVEPGTPLFIIDSDAARTAVDKARQDVLGREKQLNALLKDVAGLNLAAGYPGKLLETVDLNPGDEISKGQKVAVLADDTRLRLTQYYSYAYEGMIHQGQSVDVSIPALMSALPGTVEAVNMVSRITPEGTKLFSADILVENEGALSAEMAASATVVVDGETVYPYEPGKLEYYRTGDLKSTVNGTVLSSSLVDFLQVAAGQVLVRVDGEDSEAEIFSAQQSLDEAQKGLETAEKNLANCSAVSSIGGKIIGLTMKPGDEIAANTSVVTISDTSSLIVNATVDERNVSAVQVGTMVDLDQWGTTAMGTVESVSLSSTINNGVATYPMVISVDNAEETLQVNSYINYSLTASENDNCLILPLQAVRTVSTEEGESMTVVYVGGSKPENAVEGVMIDEMIPEGYWPVEVEIGISDNYNVEIKSGVEENTEVFTQIQISSSWGF